ncbi:MAG: 2-dehydropantoate 2-reductase [Deltaproteobacteria bacterium]|nr:MAG: 2-dehydropantoate 2-reductase [Deltaproteobacteria bacterium]
MKIAIIGPGALGCLLAASLTIKQKKIPDLDLWLLDYKPDRAQHLNEHGLILEENNQERHCKVKTTANPKDIGPADIIILCVKSQSVAAALEQAEKLFQTDTLLVTMQNGIGHLELLKTKQGMPPVVLGVTAQGANLVAPGHVRHAGSGLTMIGFLKSAGFAKSLFLAKVCNLLNDGGLETLIVDNILDYVWSKLLVNTGINALTAIHGCPNGQLLESEETSDKLAAAVKEGEAVGRAQGIEFSDDPLDMTIDVCKKTAQNISSMLQDVNNKRPTEIESINGQIVAAGKKLGIPTPVNEELLHKVQEIESTY